MKKILSIVTLFVMIVIMSFSSYAAMNVNEITNIATYETLEIQLKALESHPSYKDYPRRVILYRRDNTIVLLSKSTAKTLQPDDEMLFLQISKAGLITTPTAYTDGGICVYSGNHYSATQTSFKYRRLAGGGSIQPIDYQIYLKSHSNIELYEQDELEIHTNQAMSDVSPYITYSPFVMSFLDYIPLINKIKEANLISNDDYTIQSWDNLQNEISKATEIIGIAKTQNEIDLIYNALQSAIDGLTEKPPPVDISELVIALDDANAIDDIGYTVMSWYRLRTSVYEGESLLARQSYTQPEVDTATVNVRSAISGLELASVPEPTPEPDKHRYLVDGVLFSDLLPAYTAIMENIGAGQKFGLFVFAVLLALSVVIRIIKRFVGIGAVSRSDRQLK